MKKNTWLLILLTFFSSSVLADSFEPRVLLSGPSRPGYFSIKVGYKVRLAAPLWRIFSPVVSMQDCAVKPGSIGIVVEVEILPMFDQEPQSSFKVSFDPDEEACDLTFDHAGRVIFQRSGQGSVFLLNSEVGEVIEAKGI